ncbi:MAG: hypothetical protein IPG68_16125 [Micrococcales bacterium]|nr:hypothetical protein [Micrococcales bacterium]
MADIDEIRLADVDAGRLAGLAGTLGHSGVTTTDVDATSAASLAQAMGARMWCSTASALHRFGPPVLQAAISASVDYVDVCDDLAPTRIMLDMDPAARAAGVTALIGIGNSPGWRPTCSPGCAPSSFSTDPQRRHHARPRRRAGGRRCGHQSTASMR